MAQQAFVEWVSTKDKSSYISSSSKFINDISWKIFRWKIQCNQVNIYLNFKGVYTSEPMSCITDFIVLRNNYANFYQTI